MTLVSIIKGVGGYLPGRPVTNDDLVKRGIDTSDEWIRERTGILARHLAGPDVLTSHMAIAAGKAALAHAGLAATDIDLIILATTTPDLTMPATAVRVQAGLGCRPGIPAFDIQAVCSGFVYAITTADAYLKAAFARRVLVIGADKMSSLMNWSDRTTCVLFGDGAGAVILESVPETDAKGRGILGAELHADGQYEHHLKSNTGPGQGQKTGVLQMDGKEVFRHAVNSLASVVDELLLKLNIKSDLIDWLIPHQANTRIIQSTAKKLGMDMSKVILTIEKHGNTSAGSIPLALAEGVRDGRIKPGQLCLLDAMGAGFTWGAVLLRY
jgi:3-oxoacyl-[acyl-carrier-protein] synthase-3